MPLFCMSARGRVFLIIWGVGWGGMMVLKAVTEFRVRCCYVHFKIDAMYLKNEFSPS